MENRVLYEYRIYCPRCNSDVILVSEMISPVIVPCQGCDEAIVILSDSIFTVSYNYIKELSHKYDIRQCGKVLDAQISNKAKKLITNTKLNELHELLSQPMDVSDFIKEI